MSAMHCFECGGDCLPYRCERGRLDPRDDMQPGISVTVDFAPRRRPRAPWWKRWLR